MRVGLKLVTAPTVEQIDLKAAKDQLNVTINDDDDLIKRLIRDAREYVERKASSALMTQTWDQTMDGFPPTWSYWPFGLAGGWIELRRKLLQTVTSITYYDSTGAPNVWPSSNYLAVDGDPPRVSTVFGVTWPAVMLQPIGGVVIRFVAGYTAASLIPSTFEEAQLLMIGHWYQNREAVLTGTRLVSIETARAVEDLLGIHAPPLMA